MSDSTLSRRSAALRGLKPLTKLPTGNGENVRKFQICLVRTSATQFAAFHLRPAPQFAHPLHRIRAVHAAE